MALRRVVIASGLAVLCAGCGGMNADRSLPSGMAAYGVIPSPSAENEVPAYRIGPLDVLKLTVFQEPDLSFDQIQVDASGNVSLPLIGTVRASGVTTTGLSEAIAGRLGAKYLVDPQVSVTVVSSVSQNVTVEGSVNHPGIYAVNGTSTLLQALAQAQSPTNVAKLDQVVIFRTIDGRRAGAVFDVNAIREGRAADPQILGGDVIVVGFDSVKGAFRDLLRSAPLLGLFRYF